MKEVEIDITEDEIKELTEMVEALEAETTPVHPSELIEVIERLERLEAYAKDAKLLLDKPKKERLTRYTNEMMASAINEASGNIAEAARLIGCNYSTIYRRIAAVPELAMLIQNKKEQNLDELEMELFTQAKSGNTSALIFALKTQGYRRGYGDRSKLDVEGTFTAKHERERDALADASYLQAVLSELDGLASKSVLPSGDIIDGEIVDDDYGSFEEE